MNKLIKTLHNSLIKVLDSLEVTLVGLEGAELIFRRSSWMLFTIFIREGCLVNPLFPVGDEKRFLAQFSMDDRDSSGLAVSVVDEVVLGTSK